MKAVLVKLKALFRKLRARYPSPLPTGVSEFHEWADDIISLSGTPNNDSTKFILGTEIMRCPPTSASMPKLHFIRLLNKYASNQIGSFIVQEMKGRQEARMKEEQQKLLDDKKQKEDATQILSL